MRKRSFFCFLLVFAVFWLVVSTVQATSIVKSSSTSFFIDCRGDRQVFFSGEGVPAEGFLNFLEKIGMGVVVNIPDRDKFFQGRKFTFVPLPGNTGENLSLCSLVEAFARQMNLHARVTEDTVTFYPYVILSYTLPFPVGEISRSVSFGDGFSSMGVQNGEGTTNTESLSSGGATSASSFSLKFWSDLDKGIKMLVPQTDKKGLQPFWADRATGTLFVKVAPAYASDVDEFVKKLIDKYSKVIRVKVVLIEFFQNKGTYYSLSWKQAIKNFFNVRFDIEGQGSVSRLTGTLWNINFQSHSVDSNNLPLTQGVLGILRKYGSARVVDQATVYISNGYAAEVSRGSHREYVSSYSQTVSDGTVSTAVTKGVIMSGVRFSFRGHVLDDENWDGPPSVFLSVYSNIIKLEDLETFNTGNGQVQNPAYTGKSSFLTFVVPDRHPILLVSLLSDEKYKDRNGLPIPVIGSIFGGHTSIKQKRNLIMLLYPEILDIKNWRTF